MTPPGKGIARTCHVSPPVSSACSLHLGLTAPCGQIALAQCLAGFPRSNAPPVRNATSEPAIGSRGQGGGAEVRVKVSAGSYLPSLLRSSGRVCPGEPFLLGDTETPQPPSTITSPSGRAPIVSRYGRVARRSRRHCAIWLSDEGSAYRWGPPPRPNHAESPIPAQDYEQRRGDALAEVGRGRIGEEWYIGFPACKETGRGSCTDLPIPPREIISG